MDILDIILYTIYLLVFISIMIVGWSQWRFMHYASGVKAFHENKSIRIHLFVFIYLLMLIGIGLLMSSDVPTKIVGGVCSDVYILRLADTLVSVILMMFASAVLVTLMSWCGITKKIIRK